MSSGRRLGPRLPPVRVKDAACWLRDYVTAIRHGQLHPYTPLERKVREATRNEAWGPTGTILNELAVASGDSCVCEIIYAVLESRLQYPPEKWLNVYKSLQVLEFLMKNGSDQCVTLARGDIRPYVRKAKDFAYTNNTGKDFGKNVRLRAAEIERLLDSDQELQQLRKQLRERRAKQSKTGISREDVEKGITKRSKSWSSGNSRSGVEAGRSRRAGHTKPVSEEELKRNRQALESLLAKQHNQRCADCNSDEKPAWASINCGVFICARCAGIHRGLGVHISKVRSVVLDGWLAAQVAFMAQTGNRVANSFWEAKLPPNLRPSIDQSNRSDFISRKYRNREWADGQWPPLPHGHRRDNNPAAASGGEAAKRAPSPSGKHRPSRPPHRGPSRDPRMPDVEQVTSPAGFDERRHNALSPKPQWGVSADPHAALEDGSVGMRTRSVPDVDRFSGNPPVSDDPQTPPRVEYRHPQSRERPPAECLPGVANFDPRRPESWMVPPGSSGVLGMGGLVDNAVYSDEDADVIRTIEYDPDDEEIGMPTISSADIGMQPPGRRKPGHMLGKPRHMQDSIAKPAMQALKRGADQPKNTKYSNNGMQGDIVSSWESKQTKASVKNAMTRAEKASASKPEALKQGAPSKRQPANGPKSVRTGQHSPEPGPKKYFLTTDSIDRIEKVYGTPANFIEHDVAEWTKSGSGWTSGYSPAAGSDRGTMRAGSRRCDAVSRHPGYRRSSTDDSPAYTWHSADTPHKHTSHRAPRGYESYRKEMNYSSSGSSMG